MRTGVIDAEILDGDIRFRLVLPCEAVSVPVMRRVLGGTLLSFGADEEFVTEILLAATEACTNVLKHGAPTREYEIEAKVHQGAFLLEIAGSPPDRSGPAAAHAVQHDSPPSPAPAMAGSGMLGAPVFADATDGGTGYGRSGYHQPSYGGVAHPGAAHSASQASAGYTGPGHQAGSAELFPVRESGRGIAIMRACVDDLTLSGTADRGTVVSMRKRITWAPRTAQGTGRHASDGRTARAVL